MIILVKLISVIILVEGIVFLLSPKAMKKWVNFWAKEKRLYIGAALALLFGIIFLSIASQCKLPMVLTIMGVMSLIKGIVIFALGPEKMKARLDWWSARPAGTARIIGIIAIAIGALLLYSII